MRKTTTGLALVCGAVAVLLELSTAIDARAETRVVSEPAPAAPTGPARRPDAAAPAFDLAIIGADAKLERRDPKQWRGAAATFAVKLKNLGMTTLTEEGVACRLGAVEFTGLGGGTALKRGSEGNFVVMTKTAWEDIPSGSQIMQCGAIIVQPAKAQDANHANNVWSGKVMARDSVGLAPDLKGKTVTVRDCQTQGAPKSTSHICLDFDYVNVGGRLTQSYQVECLFEPSSAQGQPVKRTASGLTPLPVNGSARAALQFQVLPADSYRVTCTLDPAGAVPESHENNNVTVTNVAIQDAAAPAYDIAIRSVDSALAPLEGSSDGAQFSVNLANWGTKDIVQSKVYCDLGAARQRFQGSTVATAPAKPRTVYRVVVTSPNYPKARGVQSLKCNASIALPSGVTDGRPADNSWSGMIQVP